jgi:BirA family biotin operon repressor/biotin-[acetyl-CoA-carboxylase] ligase
MSASHDQLTATSLRAALARHAFVAEIEYWPQLGSTNDLAKERASGGAPEGLLVIAEEQTAGRGRMGRTWWAPRGSALLTSLLFRPTLAREESKQVSYGPTEAETEAGALLQIQALNMLCAMAAADAVTELTGLPVNLKWPNDLLVRGRKLAGLLAESVFKGSDIEAVVVGLGINVNTDFTAAPEFITSVTSLQLELGYPVDRLPLLISYLGGVARRYALLKDKSPYEEWVSRLATLGQSVTVHLSDRDRPGTGADGDAAPTVLSGLAEGVDADGALLLRTSDGSVHRLLVGDVSLSHDAAPQVLKRAAED